MKLLTRRRGISLIVVCLVGSVGVLTATATSDTEPPAGFSALAEGAREEVLTAKQRASFEDLPAGFELDLEKGYSLGAPRTRQIATGIGSPADSDVRWLVVTGNEGVCVAFSSESRMCTGDESFTSGGAYMLTRQSIRGRGDGSVQGVAPKGFVEAQAVDGDGNTLASAKIVSSTYEVTVRNAPPFGLMLVRDDGVRVRPE